MKTNNVKLAIFAVLILALVNHRAIADRAQGAIEFAIQTTKPANAASGFEKLYPKNDGKWYRLNSSGTETEIGGVGGGSASACDPATTGSVCLREDFMGGNTAVGSPVGNSAFRTVGIGSGGILFQEYETGHVGVFQIYNNNTSGSGMWMGAASSGGSGSSRMINWTDLYARDWEVVWVAKLTSTADVRLRIGLDNGKVYAGSANSSSMWIRYDTVSAYDDDAKASGSGAFVAQICGYDDANCSADASGLTAVLAGTVDTNWHRFRIYRTASKINFQVDSGATKTACLAGGGCDMTLPANPGYGLAQYANTPAVIFTAEATGSKSLYVDYAGFQMTGLGR